MNLTITIGDKSARATVSTTLKNLRSRDILDESDQDIVLSLISSLLPACNTAMTRVRGVNYIVKVQ